MRRYLFTSILLIVLAPLFAQTTTPRTYMRKVILDTGVNPSITYAEEKSAEEYIGKAWILERPEEVLTTETHSTWHLNMTQFGDDIEYPVTVVFMVELGNFETQWEIGNILHLELIHKESKESVSWELTIPEGTGPILHLDEPKIIPPYSKKLDQ